MKKTAALIFCAVLVLALIAGCKMKGTFVIDTKDNSSLTSDTVSSDPSGSSESTGSDVVIDVDDKNDDWGDVIVDDGNKDKDKDKSPSNTSSKSGTASSSTPSKTEGSSSSESSSSSSSSSQPSSSSESTSSSGSSSNNSSSKPYDDKDQGFGPWV